MLSGKSVYFTIDNKKLIKIQGVRKVTVHLGLGLELTLKR